MVTRVFGAGVAFDPCAGAVRVVFFFPDGDGGFDGIDDGAAGVEGGVSMGSGDGDGDGNFTDLEVACAVLAVGGDDVVILADFFKDALALFFGEGGEGLVFQRCDVAALVVVAHPALEACVAACSGVADCITEGAGVDGLIG